jgi:uncharacterized peroxidase-related enzyme
MTPTDVQAISYLRVPDEEEWPVEIREFAESFRTKLGFVPNILRSFALLPDHYLGWWRYFDDLMRGPGSALTKAQREMVAVVVSVENDCHYCMLSHGAACRIRTRDPVLTDTLLTNHRRADLPAPERAMLDYAVKVATAAHEMKGADIEAMRDAGWGDEEILHVIEIASMFSFTGRLANAIGLIANAEYGDLGRHPRSK